MYFQHDGTEYKVSAAYEYAGMTGKQQEMAELLRADLERIVFEMIDQAVR
jgi:hypothetical protein